MARITPIICEDAMQIVDRVGEAMQSLSNSTLLVTGAGGFLCSYLLDVIAAFNARAAAPCRVVAFDNFLVGASDRVAHLAHDPNFRFLRHDVSQPISADGPVDWVIHGASVASPTFYRRHPLETIDVNVQGTRHLLELSRRRKVRSMVFLSTSEIYGDPDSASIPTPETYRGFVSCTGPRACYDESKRLGETLCMTFFRLFGTPVKIVRPFNVYGPGQRLDDRRIIPDLMSATLSGGPMVLHSDGRATRTFCYIADFLVGFLLVMLSDANGEAFNIGNNEEATIATVAETMARVAMPSQIAIEYRGSADSDYLTDNPQRRCPDLTKARTRLHYEPRVCLLDGLARTLQSYRADANSSTAG
jgi:dTDP-glucose 4,6-dehydratase/UDP-glucuronate decarboxylase